MEQLTGPIRRIASRFAIGAAIYWTLNVVLVAAEIRWHILYRLTLWDVEQFKSLGPIFAKLTHP